MVYLFICLLSSFLSIATALRPQSDLFARELPDWQPLIETWKAKGGKHASDVVASYKTLKPAPTKDFRKIRRYSKVLMQKLRREILTPWTTDDSAVLSVAQGTYRILWLPAATGVLYTVGLGPCIGLAIEAPRRRRGGAGARGLGHGGGAGPGGDDAGDPSAGAWKGGEDVFDTHWRSCVS